MKNSDALSIVGSSPRKRGRPRAFDRDHALEQAMLLFWRKGYEGTSIVDLTEEIGIEAPSLYAAFGSKKELFTESLDCYVRSFEGVMWDNFRSAPTARDAVQAYLDDSANAFSMPTIKTPRGCMVTLASIGGEAHSELSDIIRAGRATAFTRLEARIAAGVAAEELSPTVDPRNLARYIQSVQSGMSILARDGADRAELRAVAATAMLGWDALVGSTDPKSAPLRETG